MKQITETTYEGVRCKNLLKIQLIGTDAKRAALGRKCIGGNCPVYTQPWGRAILASVRQWIQTTWRISQWVNTLYDPGHLPDIPTRNSKFVYNFGEENKSLFHESIKISQAPLWTCFTRAAKYKVSRAADGIINNRKWQAVNFESQPSTLYDPVISESES